MMLQVLTVLHYGETESENKRITLSPMNVCLVAADAEDCTVQSRSLRKVSVLFVEGGSVDLCVNHSDMTNIEQAVGTYALE